MDRPRISERLNFSKVLYATRLHVFSTSSLVLLSGLTPAMARSLLMDEILQVGLWPASSSKRPSNHTLIMPYFLQLKKKLIFPSFLSSVRDGSYVHLMDIGHRVLDLPFSYLPMYFSLRDVIL